MQLNILKIRNIFSTDSFADVIESFVPSSTYREARKDTHMFKERQSEKRFREQGGDTKQGTITIECKEGKVIFLPDAAENPEFKVKVIAEKFEEKK